MALNAEYIGPLILKESRLSENDSLLLWLLWEMDHIHISKYRPYLCILPEYEPQPIGTNLEKVNFLLRKQVTNVMNGRTRENHKTYAKVKQFMDKHPEDFNQEHYTFENWSWIRNIVT